MAETEALPAPLVPPDIDVRDLDGFMLNVERLMASELLAIGTPEQCWAALMLWCRAWKQVPAGSLPDDELILSSFSRARRRWAKVRDVALHGFIKCNDGRLYHRVLCAEAMKAFAKKTKHIEKRGVDRERLSRWRETHRETRFRNAGGNAGETRFVQEGTGTGTKSLRDLPPISESESIPARERKPLEDEEGKINGMIPIGRFAPLGADGKGSAIRRKRKELLRQKLFRFCKATMDERQREEAMMGLLADDPMEAQEWFDRLDQAMRSARWDDVAAC